MIRHVTVASFAVSALAFPSYAKAEDVKVRASGAIAAALDKLRTDFREHTGDTLVVTVDRSAEIGRVVGAGSDDDVVIAEAAVVQDLVALGRAAPGGVIRIASSPICVVIPAGQPVPAIDTAASLRRTLLEARAVGYSDSLSGRYVMTSMFPRLRISKAMRRTATQVPIATATAQGRVNIAFSQCSEMMQIPGVTVVGPLPSSLQHYSILSGFVGAGAVAPNAGRRFLAYLSTAAAETAMRSSGLEPFGKLKELSK